MTEVGVEQRVTGGGTVASAVVDGARGLVVQGRAVECPGERPSVGLAERWPIEPIHMKDRPVNGCHRPFVAEAVSNRQQRDVADAVIVRDDVVTDLVHARPRVEVAAGNRKATLGLRPPRRDGGDDWQQRERLVGCDAAAMRDVELHRRRPLHDRHREAARIEAKVRDQSRRALSELVVGAGRRSKGVGEGGELAIALSGDSRGDGIGEQIADPDRSTRA